MPTYRIDRPGMDMPRMVEAAQPSAARKYVADDEITVRRIEIGEALALQKEGVEYEVVGEEPAAAPEPAEEQQDEGSSQSETDRLRDEGTGENEPFDAGDEELEGN